MVVCKFFLQGNCKFGDNCKFNHDLEDNFSSYRNPNSTSIIRQTNFSSSQFPAKPVAQEKPQTLDADTIVTTVINDMKILEKGRQWPFSSYAPYKQAKGFPGLEDQSFEEVRLGYYEANKMGTLEQYKQQIQMMLQGVMMKIRALQSPSPEIVSMIKNTYETSASSQTESVPTNTNIFAGVNTGKQSASFNQQTSIFAQANQKLFEDPSQNPNSSIFRTANPINSFATPPPTTGTSPFAHQQTANTNIFNQGNLMPQTGGSIFVTTPVQPVAQQPLFANQNQFSNNMCSNMQYSKPFTNADVLSNPPQNSMFNQQGSVEKPPQPFNLSGGKMAGTQPPSIDDTIYSKPEELTADEIKFFESEEWDILKIPEKPPTYEMCFK